MNINAIATDNITELLQKIIEFTHTRQKILIQNINAMHAAGFVPRDLPVDEFSRMMNRALEEHASNQRLLLQDSPNIKFGSSGSFEAIPLIDEKAKILFEQNRDEYLRCQINKMLENSLNQRIAVQLLRQKQADTGVADRYLN